MPINFLEAAFTDAELEQDLDEALFDGDDEDLDSERIALIKNRERPRTFSAGMDSVESTAFPTCATSKQ